MQLDVREIGFPDAREVMILRRANLAAGVRQSLRDQVDAAGEFPAFSGSVGTSPFRDAGFENESAASE